MKKQFLLPLLILGLLAGCGTTKKLAPTRYNPQFNYTPEQRTIVSESSLTIAIINPVFSDGENNELAEPIQVL